MREGQRRRDRDRNRRRDKMWEGHSGRGIGGRDGKGGTVEEKLHRGRNRGGWPEGERQRKEGHRKKDKKA